MLEKLSVSNFALLKDTEINFSSGFTVVTGETGSGKSLLVGAISFLTGGRASSEMVRDEAKKAVIEGFFSFYDNGEKLIVRRELYPDGRSRSFIDDSPVSLKQYTSHVSQLIDITAQRSFSHLLDPSHHLYLLDSYAEMLSSREELSGFYHRYGDLLRQIKATRRKIEEFERRSELVKFQLKEINSVNPQEGEDEELSQKIHKLEHFEDIYETSHNLVNLLTDGDNPVDSMLSQASNMILQLKKWDESIKELGDEFEIARATLKEISLQVKNNCKDTEFEPDQLEGLRERQHRIAGLIKKFGGSMTSMLEYRIKLREELEVRDHSDLKLKELEKEAKRLTDDWIKLAQEVSTRRKTAAEKLERDVVGGMSKLGVKDGIFRVRFLRDENPDGLYEENGIKYDITEYGLETADFLLSANPGLEPKPLVQVASGGELSRLLLTLKALIPTRNDKSVIIFDEIDTGVSGRIASLIGDKLGELSRKRQLIAITHLPQIASQADNHIRVSKEQSNGAMVAKVDKLEGEERVQEVASLISSGKITQAALEQSRNLLKDAGERVK